MIAIIGILISLLLPAVQAAREAARKAQCANNLKQIALAALQHVESHGHFPAGGWGWRWTGDPDRGFDREQPGGWNYSILPYLEQQSIYDLGKDGQPDAITATQQDGAYQRDQSPLSVFVCPTRRRVGVYFRRLWTLNFSYYNGRNNPPTAGVLDYAANGGDQVLSMTFDGPGPSPFPPTQTYWTSIEESYRNENGIAHVRSQVLPAHVRDGLSNTYLVGEKHLGPDNYTNGMEASDDSGMYDGGKHHDNYRITDNAPRQDRPGFSSGYTPFFGGPHSGSMLFSYCDGGVRTISYAIDPETHRRLGNRKDGQVIDMSGL